VPYGPRLTINIRVLIESAGHRRRNGQSEPKAAAKHCGDIADFDAFKECVVIEEVVKDDGASAQFGPMF
jgi:hypothetical protein